MDHAMDTYRISGNPGALIEISRCHHESDNYEKSEEFFLRAIRVSREEKNDCNVFPYSELGCLFLEMGREYYMKAMNCFVKGSEWQRREKEGWRRGQREDGGRRRASGVEEVRGRRRREDGRRTGDGGWTERGGREDEGRTEG
jgi:hypothetical protein